MKCPKICPYEFISDDTELACMIINHNLKKNCKIRLLLKRLQRAYRDDKTGNGDEALIYQWQKELNRR